MLSRRPSKWFVDYEAQVERIVTAEIWVRIRILLGLMPFDEIGEPLDFISVLTCGGKAPDFPRPRVVADADIPISDCCFPKEERLQPFVNLALTRLLPGRKLRSSLRILTNEKMK